MAKKKKPIKAAKAKPVKSPKAVKPAKKAAPKKEKVVKKAPAPKKQAPQKAVKASKKGEIKKSPKPIVAKVSATPAKKIGPAKDTVVKEAVAKELVGKDKMAKSKEPKKTKSDSGVLESEASMVAERPAERDVFLTDAEGRRLCKVKDCDQLAAVEFYCRYHYLLFWKKIQNRKKILSEGKLEQYIEELTSRYPVKFLELIRKDLHTEADFMSAIQELDIDESSTLDEFEEDENFIDEVRGISAEAVDRSDDEF